MTLKTASDSGVMCFGVFTFDPQLAPVDVKVVGSGLFFKAINNLFDEWHAEFGAMVMGSKPTGDYKKHPFYIFSAGVVAGVIGTYSIINYFTPQKKSTPGQIPEGSCPDKTKIVESLNNKIDVLRRSQSEEKRILLQQTEPFLRDSVSITLKHTHPKPYESIGTNINKGRRPYSVDATILVHGDPSEEIKDKNVGETIELDNYQVVISSAARDRAEFKVISKGLKKILCDE